MTAPLLATSFPCTPPQCGQPTKANHHQGPHRLPPTSITLAIATPLFHDSSQGHPSIPRSCSRFPALCRAATPPLGSIIRLAPAASVASQGWSAHLGFLGWQGNVPTTCVHWPVAALPRRRCPRVPSHNHCIASWRSPPPPPMPHAGAASTPKSLHHSIPPADACPPILRRRQTSPPASSLAGDSRARPPSPQLKLVFAPQIVPHCLPGR